MAKPKTVINTNSVANYLHAIEPESKRNDTITIVALMQHVTACKPQMWGESIVGFNPMPDKHNNIWPSIAVSARKQNIVLYMQCNAAPYAEIMSRLGKVKLSKACVYLNKLADVNIAVLEELIMVVHNQGSRE